jgi:hypothetical protein
MHLNQKFCDILVVVCFKIFARGGTARSLDYPIRDLQQFKEGRMKNHPSVAAAMSE